jgi:hypothetical protein
MRANHNTRRHEGDGEAIRGASAGRRRMSQRVRAHERSAHHGWREAPAGYVRRAWHRHHGPFLLQGLQLGRQLAHCARPGAPALTRGTGVDPVSRKGVARVRHRGAIRDVWPYERGRRAGEQVLARDTERQAVTADERGDAKAPRQGRWQPSSLHENPRAELADIASLY